MGLQNENASRRKSRTISILLISCFIFGTTALENFNITEDSKYLSIINKNGKTVFMSEELKKKLDRELETWHWTPWLRTRTEVSDYVVQEVECIDAQSIESFPDIIFSEEQLRQGAFLLFVLFGIYSFTLLAIVCNDYFLPCVELICEDLKIPQNVAAATFMSVATSCPEFFVNLISTFLTESDMGIGTIVGSALFNALGVAAIGGLAAISPIAIEMRPVTRDVIIYMINVSVLVAIVWDGQVDWHESLVLFILYIVYFIIMFNSVRMFKLYDKIMARFSCCQKNNNLNVDNKDEPSMEEGIDNKGYSDADTADVDSDEKSAASNRVPENETSEQKAPKSILRCPKGKSILYIIGWLYIWPLKFILGLTIPSPITHRGLYPLSFFMCIIWIGVNSYLVSWSMTVIGHTFFIPDSVMGMTFLAFGGCLPEAFSIFIMSRKGKGGIGVSNALGANSLAILFALGVPWLIRTLTLVGQGAENPVVYINSTGIDFVVSSLLVAVTCLWIIMFFSKFKLRRSSGFVLILMYAIFITFAILVEMGIILDRDISFC